MTSSSEEDKQTVHTVSGGDDDDVYCDAVSTTTVIDTNQKDKMNTSNTPHEANLQLDSSMQTNFKMRLFLLRYTKSKENIRIEGHFSENVKLDFAQRAINKEKGNDKVHIFNLELDLVYNNAGELCVLYKNKLHHIIDYRLRLFSHEDIEMKRVLRDPRRCSCEFLFDVHFKKGYTPYHLPGSEVPFWSQLCLLTCFFLQQSTYDIFNEFMEQFRVAIVGRSFDKDFCTGFISECNSYIVYSLKNTTNKAIGIKQVVLMIGVLPIDKQNYEAFDHSTECFTTFIMSELKKSLKDVISYLTENERNSFNNGISILICIQLLNRINKTPSKNPLELLLDASIQTARLYIVKKIIDFFENIGLEEQMPESMWLQLLALDSCDALIDRIPLKPMLFEAYLKYIKEVIPALSHSVNFISRLSTHFDNTAVQGRFLIDLKSITHLLKFLRHTSSDDTNPDLRMIHSFIDASVPLREKIKEYMSTLKITIDDFDSIREIFILSEKSNILFHVKRKEFLCKILTNGNHSNSVEFYKRWFSAFMAPNDKKQLIFNADEFKELLKAWTTCFTHKSYLMIEIIKEIDKLISITDGHSYAEHFIKHMAEFCFEQKLIIEEMEKSVLLVQSPKFLNAFKLKYKTNVLNAYKDSFKELENPANPLHILKRFDDKTKYQNGILRELIEMACEDIQIEDDEILQDVFYKPDSQSFTYSAIFLPSFKTTRIRQYIVDRLLVLSTSWEEKGMQLNDLSTWNNYTEQQRAVALEVWAHIGEVSSKKFEMNTLINKENDNLKKKLQITEMISSCIDIYCSNATDKQHYKDLLKNIDNSFVNQTIRSIAISEEMEKIVPIAQRLDPYSKSNVWHLFRQETMTSVPLTKDTNAQEASDSMTCSGLLLQAEKIFDLFTTRLKDICSNWKTLLISNWIHSFPDIHYIDYDFDILKPLLDAAVVPILKQILGFWKDRENFICICQGIINLLTYLQVLLDDETRLLFNSIEQLNENKTGDEIYKVYEYFSKNYLRKYPRQVLNLISQYKISDELITFLHKLPVTDVDNLLEAVNDWDETLISTKIILDLVLIKNFLDQIYANIKSGHKNQSLQNEIHRIILCFEEKQKDEKSPNIIQCFESCSKSLTSIKRVHMDLTNKEQSKRRYIFDIVQNASFNFDQTPVNLHGRIEYRFDVFCKQQTMRYADLSELCDRARLIQYSTNSTNKIRKDSEQEIRDLQSFINMVSVIETVLTHLTSLNMTGHPFVLKYLSAKSEFTCIAGNYQNLSDFNSSLETLLTDWENNLCEMYKEYIDLTYFVNQQFWTVEDYLYRKSASDDHLGFHLLNFIGIDPKQIERKFLTERSEQPHERLKNIARILEAQRTKYKTNVKVENSSFNKVLVIQTSYEGILCGILSLFELTKVHPQVHNIFYCSNTTNWIEMRAFAYRCLYSQGILHQLIRPELLPALVQDQLTKFLYKFIKQQPKQLFHLGIVTTELTVRLQLVNALKASDAVTIIQNQNLLVKAALHEMIKTLVMGNCTLITSRIAGLGKSTYIRNEIQRNQKHYVKFSINGNINVDTLAERLRFIGQEMIPINIALHIDIGIVDNIQQLNELLYCLLLFRRFRFGQEAVYIPVDIPIYIELDSSPHSLTAYNKITILQFLPCHRIETMDLHQLKVENMASLQLVVNYLQAIDNGAIIKQNITKENITQLGPEKCVTILQKHFLQGKNSDYITWTQLSIFISVYESLFDGFSRCGHFIVEMMQEVNNTQLRINILQTLLQSSNQFTSLSVESVRKNQRSTDDDSPTFSDAIVRWDKSQPFTVVFSDSHDPIFVYKTVDNVSQSLQKEFEIFNAILKQIKLPQQNLLPDYTKLKHAEFFVKLASLSKKYYSKPICPNCFTQFENNILNCTNCPTKNVLCNPNKAKSEAVDKIIERLGDKIKSEYVLTPDNYIKMLLIYLRVQSHIPVLIMGETGCGKTALIQFLCQKILNDELAIFRIHAGITNEKIIETMKDFIAKANEFLRQNSNKRLWVFLDEFNTTSSIGLFKEITCERTLLGESLPKNLVILGACNPQRRKNPKAIFDDEIGIKKDRYETQRLTHIVGSMALLYTVVPIPETMLEYVWDYGYLDSVTEMKYVRAMLNSCEQLHSDSIWFEKTALLIQVSQQFFRDHEDVSSVSLRDVARFCRLYNWFLKSICIREGEEQLLKNKIDVLSRSTLIALSLCYFFRLNGPTERQTYIEEIQKALTSDGNYTGRSLVETLRSEEKKLVDLMELPSGTATNRTLTDNIFVLIACITNRIPVILCGKPGCSKTSSVQIVLSNLKGKKSKNAYFQTLPELVSVSFQGSQNCTSDSIIKVFQRADKYRKAKSESDLLPVIVFDEIGLAELSPHNALKVLHSELEVEACRHAFIGLSNWRLDASKMNRALYLACPDPDVTDLQSTAKAILQSMISTQNQIARIDDELINSLAAAYFSLYEYIRVRPQYNNYFGLRDFYSLIKGVIRELVLEKENGNIYQQIRQQLTVNFDGSFDGSHYMWHDFCQHLNKMYLYEQYKTSPAFNDILNQCMSSRSGRYLMLIGENESVIDYAEQYIINKFQPPPVRTLIGSSFSGDLVEGSVYTEQYNYRVLMDIILYAETPVTLVMRRMGHLYDNLYDLFNQSFAVSGNKQYCRIPLGPLYHPRCLVHENFYCVVFVRQQDVDKCDPPFLNRFEKHVINMESLVHRRHRTVALNLISWTNKLLITDINEQFPLEQHLFVDYSNDFIYNLVIDAFTYLRISIEDNSKDNEEDTNAVISFCKKRLIHTSSFDFPLIMSLKETHESRSLIDQYYEFHENLSFSRFIDKALRLNVIDNQVIYTYTQLYQTIENINNGDSIEEIKLNNFKTELELTNKIKVHYRLRKARLLLIRVDYHEEHEHILLLKHILLNEHRSDSNCGVWVIFHLQRNLLTRIDNDVIFNGWPSIMINNLNDNQLLPREILFNSSYIQLIAHPICRISDISFTNLIGRCLTKMRYTVVNQLDEQKINEYRNRIIDCFTQRKTENEIERKLRSIIEDLLSKLIQTIPFDKCASSVKDWRRYLLTTSTIIGSCRSFEDALHATVASFYDKYLLLLFGHLEQYSFIDTYYFLSNEANKIIHDDLYKIWYAALISTLETVDRTIMNRDIIEISLLFNLRLPCATIEYENIRQVRDATIKRSQTDEEIPDDELLNQAMKQLHEKSVYKEYIKSILSNRHLFVHYYFDQLLLAQDEAKVYQLPNSFVQRLVTLNPTRSIKDQLKHLLIDHIDLFEILRIF
ncbi:unnamed protein product [Adineta ricciae]|uniref:AAA+ ATPase domain-containing protein n=1 Tax=Adineta ricciae TaxID=249248 RepID=A0A814MQM5_ADIRI|nr:unnamed protein product [Adineta ricciae]